VPLPIGEDQAAHHDAARRRPLDPGDKPQAAGGRATGYVKVVKAGLVPTAPPSARRSQQDDLLHGQRDPA
jgi:hypothetical protein